MGLDRKCIVYRFLQEQRIKSEERGRIDVLVCWETQAQVLSTSERALVKPSITIDGQGHSFIVPEVDIALDGLEHGEQSLNAHGDGWMCLKMLCKGERMIVIAVVCAGSRMQRGGNKGGEREEGREEG